MRIDVLQENNPKGKIKGKKRVAMTSVFITGASRGIGLEFVRQYAQDGFEVHAVARNPQGSKPLMEVADVHANVALHALDVSDFAAIESLGKELAGIPMDILINNAGHYGPKEAQSLGKIDYKAWAESFKVNALAPIKLAETFLANIEQGSKKVIATLSTQMASIADNTSGGVYVYRSSKAALNIALKSLSVDLKPKGVSVLILHPGWVKTDMGGEGASVLPAESVHGMRRLIDSGDLSLSGTFLNYKGEELPW